MNKSVSHYLRDYLQLTGSAKFNFLTGGAERPLTASEASDLQAVINKYMIDIVPAVAANDVFKKQLMTKEQFDAARVADATKYGAFADYTAFTADWKDVQKALVAALLLAADAEMAAAAPGEAASAPAGTGSPGKGSPGSAAAASVATGSPGTGAKPQTPGSAVSPAGTGSPGAAAASPFTFRLRGGAASPSLLAAAIAASGVVVASGPPELKHFFTYFSVTDKTIPDEFFTDLKKNKDALKALLKKDILKLQDTSETFTRIGILSNKLAVAKNVKYSADNDMVTTIGVIINKLSTIKNSFPDAIKKPSAP
jgi:hypothetical protein